MIALITDFGWSESYAGILKGVIKNIYSGVEIIDITHDCAPYSVTNAQYHLFSSYRHFPRGTIFMVIVDPGVGSERKCLIARHGGYFFLVPDNGIISAVRSRETVLHEIDAGMFPGASPTFHGRDIFAPVAAGLSMGRGMEIFGSGTDNVVEKKFPDFTMKNHGYECRIIHRDRFGNAVTSLPAEAFKGRFTRLRVRTAAMEFPANLCRTYRDLNGQETGLMRGSSGFLELAMNMGSAAENLGLNIDDPIMTTGE